MNNKIILKRRYTQYISLFLCIMLSICSYNAISQSYTTLTFTGRSSLKQEHIPLHYIEICNITQHWEEGLYYPDTILQFGGVGIDEYNNAHSVLLLQNVPNPFDGVTDFILQLEHSMQVLLEVYNLTGQKVLEYTGHFPAGSHLFMATLSSPQTYLLSATAQDGRMSIKMVNKGTGENNSLTYLGSFETKNIPLKLNGSKGMTPLPFMLGDEMVFIGHFYEDTNGQDHISQTVQQRQWGTESITLFFEISSADVQTNQVTNVEYYTATCGGNVTSDGGLNVTARGVCWSTSHNPTISNSHTTDGNGVGSFTSSITGLTPNTTYYVRAYATNSLGTAYGSEVSFTTSCNNVAVSVSGTTSITTGQSTTLTASGASSYRWSTGATTATITVSPTTTTTYTVTGTNQYGCTGTKSVTVTVNSSLPTVTSNSVSNIAATSATCGGNVTNDGGTSVTVRGVCWSTNQNPTVSGSHTTNGNGTGSFTSSITGLTPNTTYYVRAYATNSVGTAYGNEVSFTTSCNNVSVSVSGTTSIITGQSTTLTASGASSYRWSTGATTATITVSPTTTTTYTVTGTNQYGCTGSASVTVTVSEVALPTVTTNTVSSIGTTSATCGGNVTNDGGATVTARGVCWSTGQNPTVSGNHTTNGSGTGSFTSNLTGLTPNTTYYVRAYATNSAGTGYGEQKSFTTLPAQGQGAIVILEAHDVWGDSTGYQLLLDVDATAYGTIIPTSDNLSSSGDVPASTYTEFEYKIPENADGSLTTTNIVYDGSATITIPAGTYDFCVTNPTPNDKMYIAGGDYGRQNDYVFQDGWTYHFTVAREGPGDAVTIDVIPNEPAIMVNPAALDFVQTITNTTATLTASVIGHNLTDGISATISGESYLISADGTTFSTTATLPTAGGTLTVQFFPTAIEYYADTITLTSGEVTATIILTGEGFECPAITTFPYVCTFAEDDATLACWEIVDVNGDANVEGENMGAFSFYGSGWSTDNDGIAQYFYSPSNVANDWLISPEFNGTDLYAKFDYMVRSSTYPEEFEVYVIGEGQTYANATEVIAPATYTNESFKQHILNLSAYNDQNIRIAIHATSPADQYGIVIDNFMVDKSTPDITTNQDAIDFGNQGINTTSYDRTFTVMTTAITGNVIVSTSTPFAVSLDGLSFASVATIPATTDFINETIVYVQYAPPIAGIHTGNITITDGNLTATVALYGEAITVILPTVTTNTVSNITSTSATCGGNVTSDGGASVTARGVCWGTSHNPTISNSHTTNGNGTGSFTSSITGLTPNTTYYVRAYATNSVGTAYGNEVSFTTTSAPSFTCGTSTLTDIDGNTYNTVQIGGQCWMKENLRTTKYPDGTGITKANSEPSNISEACWFYPSDDSTTKQTYGLLYNWEALMYGHTSSNATPSGVQGICPDGWHIPSRSEWSILTDYVSNQNQFICDNTPSAIAWALADTMGWDTYDYYYCTPSYNPLDNNATGFSALPSDYSFLGFLTSFGSSTGASTYYGYTLHICGIWEEVQYSMEWKQEAYAVRCVHNEEHSSFFPTVTTSDISNITSHSVTCGGTITSNGNVEVTSRGICWSTNHNPSIIENHSANSSGPGTFSNIITDLTSNITYYVRAYATNQYGTVYGNEVSFIIPINHNGDDFSCPNEPTVTDIDGNVYNTVLIGGQCWMRENLRTTRYADGTDIPQGEYSPQYGYYSGYWYYPYDDSSYLQSYGLLYNWKAVMRDALSSDATPSGVQGACPDGWHVPSNSEWLQLIDYVSSHSEYACGNNNNNIAKSLASKVGWQNSNTTCSVGNTPSNNNATRFGALPTGYLNGGYIHLRYSDYNTSFWSATAYTERRTYYFYLGYNSVATSTNTGRIKEGYSVRCLQNEGSTQYFPTVTTNIVTSVTANTASCGGNVTSINGAEVTSRGVCWSIHSNPTIADRHTTDGSGTGSFNSSLTDLASNFTYYVRAYATNQYGTVYGNEVSFTTPINSDGDSLSCSGTPILTDRDGNVYNTVQIGNQCWMRENLRTTKYADGTDINYGYSQFYNTGYWYYPAGRSDCKQSYGLLYNWKAVMRNENSSEATPSGVQGICPTGWHVPSNPEWTQLTNYVSSQNEYGCGNNNSIAKALASTMGWENSSYTCSVGNIPTDNNASGFGAVPAGDSYANDEGAYNLGSYAYFWSATETSSTNARYLFIQNAQVGNSSYAKFSMQSVRCLRDEGNSTTNGRF